MNRIVNLIDLSYVKFLIGIFGCSLLTMTYGQTTFNQSEFIWDLTEIYNSDDDWERDKETLNLLLQNQEFDSLPAFKSSEELLSTLNKLSQLRVRTSKVAFYAILRWEEGKVKNGDYFLEQGEALLASFEAILSGLEGKILLLDKSTLQDWLQSDKGLYKHRHWLNQIIDQKDYRSSPEVEFALRKIRSWISSSIESFWSVQRITKLWPTILDEKGEEIILNRSAFRSIRKSNNLTYRDKAAEKYYTSLDDVSEVLGGLYVRKIRSELELARLRGFSDGIDANWFFYSGAPEGSYKMLLKQARKNKGLLQRYARLRSKIFKKEKITYLDFYKTPSALENFEYNFNTSMGIALEAAEQIGGEFHENMKFAFENKHWMHLADVPKTARYHIRPAVTGIHPYFILKYRPEIIESRALVGGLFSLATDISSIGADGIDIFETEAPIHISGPIYAGDILHDKILASKSSDKNERKAHLLQSMEFLRRFFRNSIFIELDAKVQQAVEQEEQVEGSDISEMYLEILRDYYGHSKGVMNIPEYVKNDWMTETAVMFMPKYEHHFWAPSMAVGAAMATNGKYKNLFLSRYDNEKYDSYSMLKEEGFDLLSEDAYDSLFRLMESVMDEIEQGL